MPDVILEGRNIFLSFQGVAGLTNVSFQVQRSEIFSIIGPNGSGKTSLINCISGFYHPRQGRIFYSGQDITDLPPHRRAGLGIARTFQEPRLFQDMTVMDNILLGRHIHLRSGIFGSAVHRGKTRREEAENRKFIEEEIMDLLKIQALQNATVGLVPYGMQKRIEFGRALALQPELILLDEPFAGLNALEIEVMARLIVDINTDCRWKITCVLMEHDMGVVMELADRIMVLNYGINVAEGTAAEIRDNSEVVNAYLAESDDLYVSHR